MRFIPYNAECAEVLIGSMNNLTRPIIAFVRLSQSQLIGRTISMLIIISLLFFVIKDNISETSLPIKFIFLLVGPATGEYFEIGRSLGTLFSTSVSADFY